MAVGPTVGVAAGLVAVGAGIAMAVPGGMGVAVGSPEGVGVGMLIVVD